MFSLLVVVLFSAIGISFGMISRVLGLWPWLHSCVQP